MLLNNTSEQQKSVSIESLREKAIIELLEELPENFKEEALQNLKEK